MPLRIGVHPNNLHLRLAARWPGALAELDPVFIDYPEGRDTAQLLAANAFDIGGTGSTPPILAEAGGQSVVYVAASLPRPTNGAILVSSESQIDGLAQLKGQTIALVDGSFLTYLLAKSLEDEGLTLRNVDRRDIPPALSRDQLKSGEVAAWVAMAPHLEQSLATNDVRVLAHCGSIIPNRSLFWTLRERQLGEGTVAAFAAELDRVGKEIAADPERAAALLAEDASESERRAWTRVVAERNWHVVPADRQILREQQAEADTLFQHSDIDRRLEIAGLQA